MNELEEQYTPTPMQHALGAPLLSEQRTGQILTRVLSRVDLLALFITSVLYIPTVSIVAAAHGTGIATYLYWVIGTVTFLIPGAVIVGQLTRFMPVDGAIYVWTHRTLGPIWGFFAGFCAWFAGMLALLGASVAVLSMVKGMSIEWLGSSPQWLATTWQQGFVVIGVLLLVGWLSTRPLRLIMRIAKIVIFLYLLGIVVVGAGGIPHVDRFFLRWGPPIVLLAYLLATFGVNVVVPQQIAVVPHSTLIVVKTVFGTPAAVIVGCISACFFVMAAVLYNVAFARNRFVAAIDQRLPAGLTRLNRFAAPSRATNVQVIIVLTIAVGIFWIGPFIFALNAATLSTVVYTVATATTAVIWCLSMVILFLVLPIVLGRFRTFLESHPDQLIAPRWILYLCAAGGAIASLAGILTTFTQSWEPELISTAHWVPSVSLSVLIVLAIGLLGAAYPRLWGSLEKQTAAAREIARLYNELSVAHRQLRELEQLKDMSLSHEFRTPLTIMQGNLELLREMEDASPDLRRSFLDKAIRACDELVLLQANIMDASRIEVDATTLHCVSVALLDLCTAVIDLFEPCILQEQRSIEVDIAKSIFVWADELRLKQVLRNLIAMPCATRHRTRPFA